MAKSNIIIFIQIFNLMEFYSNVPNILPVPGLSVFWAVAHAPPLHFLMNHGLEIAG